MKEKSTYYKKLDIIRNISCIMVLLYHLNILPGGFLAVCAFFTLSGYLSCTSALKNEKFSVKSYYISRFKKLYLPLAITVFLTVICAKIIPNITWLHLKEETISVLLGYNNFWQLATNQDYFTKNANSPFIHFWYISILIQFELIFPIIVALFKRVKQKARVNISGVIVVLLTIISTALFYYMSLTKDIMVVYYNTFARVFSIFFGILLAILNNKYGFKLAKRFRKFSTIIFAIYAMLFISFSIFISADSKQFAIFMILTSLITARMIEYATLNTEKRGKTKNITKTLASFSYEIYLVQYPIIFFMQNLDINKVVKTILCIILTFIISYILYIILNYKSKRKIAMFLKTFLIVGIILIGSYLVITEKDHTDEMNELKELLNANSNELEQNNESYLNNNQEENKTENNEVKNNENNSENTTTSVKTTENKTQNGSEKSEDEKQKVYDTVTNLPVVGIGDSVLLGAVKELKATFPNGYFDGKVSRNLSAGETILKDLKSKGKLGNTVILALANNGDYSTKKNKELMEILGDRELYWVNAVGADDPTFNSKFREFAKDYPNIHIVEWDVASKNHPEYFYADGIHTKGAGLKKYASTIYDAICKVYLEK